MGKRVEGREWFRLKRD